MLTLSVLAAGCLAIGSAQAGRSFWAGFLFASIGVLWVNYSETAGSLGLARVSLLIADVVDNRLDWSTPRGEPGTTEYYVDDDLLRIYKFDEQGKLRSQMPVEKAAVALSLLQKARPIASRPSGRIPNHSG